MISITQSHHWVEKSPPLSFIYVSMLPHLRRAISGCWLIYISPVSGQSSGCECSQLVSYVFHREPALELISPPSPSNGPPRGYSLLTLLLAFDNSDFSGNLRTYIAYISMFSHPWNFSYYYSIIFWHHSTSSIILESHNASSRSKKRYPSLS